MAAAALNFKDVMLAYGKLNRDLMASGFSKGALGFEFAGTRQARRVMGVAYQAIATCCGTPDFLVSALERGLFGHGYTIFSRQSCSAHSQLCSGVHSAIV